MLFVLFCGMTQSVRTKAHYVNTYIAAIKFVRFVLICNISRVATPSLFSRSDFLYFRTATLRPAQIIAPLHFVWRCFSLDVARNVSTRLYPLNSCPQNPIFCQTFIRLYFCVSYKITLLFFCIILCFSVFKLLILCLYNILIYMYCISSITLLLHRIVTSIKVNYKNLITRSL